MSHVRDVCIMCGKQSVFCAGFGSCYVWNVAGFIREFSLSYAQAQSVLRVGFSMCYVLFAVASLVAWLLACLASVGKALTKGDGP